VVGGRLFPASPRSRPPGRLRRHRGGWHPKARRPEATPTRSFRSLSDGSTGFSTDCLQAVVHDRKKSTGPLIVGL